MQLYSLQAKALLALTIGIFATTTTCQVAAASGTSTASEMPQADDVGGLPAFLLPVPAGPVLMGMEVDRFVDACSEAAYYYNPKIAHIQAEDKFKTAMRRSSSMIGRRSEQVAEYYLGKWPVKNSEYLVFVDKMRAAGVDVRPPFHWWRYGCPDHYNQSLAEIRKRFPKDPAGAILYWEAEGHKLPYKMQDKNGKSIGEHPLVYITWREANVFAASIGMRLPTEVELTRAMRGDGSQTWPGGERGPDQDKYSEEMLKYLGMASTSNQKTKPVGTIKGAVGPFGHVDMFGQVWQLVGDLGFGPIHDMDTFLTSWKALQKHKTGRLVELKPTYEGHKTIAKGGSFLSFGEPVQLMLDARAPILTTDCLEALGMRLAKSLTPGYDYLYSLQRVQFDTEAFAQDQQLNLGALVGAERYTLSSTGFPSNYEAIAFAPVNWLSAERNTKLKSMLEESQKSPLLIGAIATTAKFENGAKPGLYSVFYRQAGIPKELRTAIKSGYKEVTRARKAAAKRAAANPKAKDAPQKPAPVRKWRMVIKKFGLTDDDVALPKASNGDCGYVVIDGIKIPTNKESFILATKGKMVAVMEGTKNKPARGDTAGELEMTAGEISQKNKTIAKFRIGIPMTAGKKGNSLIVFDLPAVLDQEPPTEAKPWRLPKQK